MNDGTKSVCFAYFGDGKFLGWYADSFGSVRKNQPKVYTNSEKQIEIITKNFRYKISELKHDSNLGDRNPALSIIDNSLKGDSKLLYPKKHVELRIVECPKYTNN